MIELDDTDEFALQQCSTYKHDELRRREYGLNLPCDKCGYDHHMNPVKWEPRDG